MTAAIAPRASWWTLLNATCARYSSAGRFARRFARGKLFFDPVFPHLLRHGLIAPQAHVLDIGCGQGLIATLLAEADALASRGQWPSGWATAPRGARVTGIDLMPRDIERARAAIGVEAATFICGDMRHTPFPAADTVVILDVMHYISVPEQDEVLARVRNALQIGGRLLMRIGDAAVSPGFLLSQWADAVITFFRGNRVLPHHVRPLAAWIARLQSLGFEVRCEPMSRGTPFSNVLLIAQVRSAAQPETPGSVE